MADSDTVGVGSGKRGSAVVAGRQYVRGLVFFVEGVAVVAISDRKGI